MYAGLLACFQRKFIAQAGLELIAILLPGSQVRGLQACYSSLLLDTAVLRSTQQSAGIVLAHAMYLIQSSSTATVSEALSQYFSGIETGLER